MKIQFPFLSQEEEQQTNLTEYQTWPFQRQFGLLLAGLVLTLLLSGMPVVSLAHAMSAPQATINVTTNTPDVNTSDGLCSLIEAIMNANGDNQSGSTECTAGSGADTINLLALSTHTLNTINNSSDGDNGLPSIISEIIIEGNGATIERDSSAPSIFRLFHVSSTGHLTLTQSTIQNGDSSFNLGGGIYNGGNLLIKDSIINNNESGISAGGIYNNGNLTIQNSTLSGNQSGDGGGGIFNHNVITIQNSTLSGNMSSVDAGAIFNIGTLTIQNSTLSGNNANGNGGAIFNNNILMLQNSTLSGNTSNSSGAGIFNKISMTLQNSLVSGNTATSGVNEIVNSTGTVNVDGNNLFGDSSQSDAQAFFGFTPGASDITATSDGTMPAALSDILNTTLANNGGPTLTHALVSGSPAIDAGDSTTCASTGIDNLDQRNATRAGGAGSGGSACDIGAYEFNSPPLAVDLASFGAVATEEHVVVTWQTVSEVDNLGFNLYRATDINGEQIRLNSDLIAAQAPGSGQGGTYEFVDGQVEAGQSYYYWLEDVDINGQRGLHGPISATATVPTAVTVSTLESKLPNQASWLLGFMALTLLAGTIWLKRRGA